MPRLAASIGIRSTLLHAPRLVSLAIIASALALTSPLRAATETWTGSTSGNWNVAGNWTGTNTPPLANDILIFDGNANTLTNNDFAANTQFNGITFAATAGRSRSGATPLRSAGISPTVRTISRPSASG